MKKQKKMKNKIYILYCLILFCFIASCSEKNKINVIIDNANGLKQGANVICKGKEVGKVFDITFIGRKLNIELELEKDFFIPKGSKVYLVSTDILGTRALAIELSNENEYYAIYDTLICYDKSGTRLDTTLMIINSAIEEIKDSIPKLLQLEKE